MSRTIIIVTTSLILFRAGVLLAQGSPTTSADSARCDSLLNTPTRDSALVEYDALVIPFDTSQHLAVFYREMLGQGLREQLKLPRPLAVSTYANHARVVVEDPVRGDYAIATLRSVYRFALHRNGRLTDIRVVGGVRNAAFDDAVVAALVRLDSAQELPTPPDSTDFDHDSLDVRLTVTPGLMVRSHFSGKQPARPGSTPLFRLRLPVRPIEKDVAAKPDNPRPRYPLPMRDKGIEGEVLAEFVVRPSGEVDPTSIQFLKATGLDFASAIAEVVPSFNFYPMQIASCNVPALVQMPFLFGLNR